LQVDLVEQTQIFARAVDKKQILVYSMSILTHKDVAMILPLPVPPGCPEDQLRFINLQGYPNFFADLHMAFWQPPHDNERSLMLGGLAGGPLPVHDVGLFAASFVPSIDDFGWLDPRFRLTSEVWAKLPQYADWGFAVFKLKPDTTTQAIHPMALEFPRRNSRQLFFPTVHVHDGQIHPEAEFDHALYAQIDRQPGVAPLGPQWSESLRPIGRHIDCQRAAGVIAPDLPVYRRQISGLLPNQDVILDTLLGNSLVA
jgi:hypothetical protein